MLRSLPKNEGQWPARSGLVSSLRPKPKKIKFAIDKLRCQLIIIFWSVTLALFGR